jgi:hypothetical protein
VVTGDDTNFRLLLCFVALNPDPVVRTNRTTTDRLQRPGATRAPWTQYRGDFPKGRLAPAPSVEHNFTCCLIFFCLPKSGAAKRGAVRSLRDA